MFDIVLYQPEIPPNTGNLIRLAANTGCRLHLVEPLGFDLSDKQVARAGLDYHDMACVQVHADWAAVKAALPGRHWFALTTKGSARYAENVFQAGDVFVFGPESRGLPPDILDGFDADHRLRLPMLPGSRSMNLSNAVSVVVFEAWRQNGFAGGA
ncbi:MAG TPA: tRNA (cytidine(34)-2'-O)-methyltransferase [Thiobacillus sp.]|nr:MAG: tRNA (uridine(34)/cytosine(34)/5-carboxymethylaminomethyluridine(34)-2'-O)-methyltransferase TrmL [Hydrogenophilales bacterium 28-61-11]OYZ57541.1 MAG: tRNA (uridine(34)/cytosine(34)/5-carboxymethylaminomethyluridine(34)-2'-O)-methyltransferase TrmL [Hydrogenophilales bacterium 16-61-112]HQT30506.1 tRNA (cytidine(34)-2'-O)-methyltransferase [Thiobacillus sp.]HQT70817.1 tRNA (cytidine(34)-2'-O)-methyltransferase [Thiobacillus sp.]